MRVKFLAQGNNKRLLMGLELRADRLQVRHYPVCHAAPNHAFISIQMISYLYSRNLSIYLFIYCLIIWLVHVSISFFRFFTLFEKYNGYKKGHLKLKKPKQLQEVLDIARDLLSESQHDPNPEVLEKKAKLQQLKLVLEM